MRAEYIVPYFCKRLGDEVQYAMFFHFISPLLKICFPGDGEIFLT